MSATSRLTHSSPPVAAARFPPPPTPPPHGNFTKPITVYRGPYEYSVPGDEKDFTPQSEPPKDSKAPDDKPHA